MPRPRALVPILAVTGALAAPAAALAGAGQSADYLPTLRTPAVSPVAIHGDEIPAPSSTPASACTAARRSCASA